MGFLGVYRALYDYVPTAEGELAINEGDLVFVLDRGEDGWWRAKKKAASEDEDEPEGLIPENYVEEAKSISAAKALYDYTRQTDEELSFAEDEALEVYDNTDQDWTLVGSKGDFGFAPANYIELAEAAPPTPKRPQPVQHEQEEPGPPTPSSSPSPVHSPAAALAGIIAQRTGGGIGGTTRRAISPPPQIQAAPRRVQFTPEESEDEAPPPVPQRPISEVISPPHRQTRFAESPREIPPAQSPLDSPGIMYSPPIRQVSRNMDHSTDDDSSQPRGYHIYNIFEMVEVMGKNKKMPVTLGINIAKGVIMISGEKERSSKEWSADKLTHYSIEGKHVFMELVRPSKSIDFHAGAKDTAHEIITALGDLAGMVRAEGLKEVFAAANGTSLKKGKMIYEFMAQGDDEVTVAEGDEVIILDDTKSEEWWMIRRLKNNKEGVVPSNYVDVIGPVLPETSSAASGLRSFVEQNRLDEEQASRAAAKKKKDGLDPGNGISLPKRHSSLMPESSQKDKRSNKSEKKSSRYNSVRKGEKLTKAVPDTSKVRTWTDRSGSFKVEAEFIGLRDEKIHLHKLNGVKIAVPVPKMSKEDLDYVEKATGKSLGDLRPVADIIRQNSSSRSGSSGAQIQAKKSDYDWFDFFLSSGVDPNICQRYASAFDRDQMGEENLQDINPTVLRTLGLKEGDILRVMKFLDSKFGRKRVNFAEGGEEGGLFSGPGGTLKNNTAKGRPTPPVQTNSELNLEVLAKGGASSADKQTTARANAPSGGKTSDGFDDDAWAPRPSRSTTTSPTPVSAASSAMAPPPAPVQPTLTPGMAAMSLLDEPLVPSIAPQPAQQQSSAAPPPQGATPGLFEQLAQPGKQRPQAPQQSTGDGLIAPPPNRSASAPHNNQQSGFQPPPLQAQLTGYQQPRMQTFAAPPGQSMLDVQQQQQLQRLQQHQTAFTAPLQPMPTGFPPQNSGFNQFQQNGIMPQPTGYGMQFQQTQPTGFNQFQPSYQQALQNGQSQANGSPFADPPRAPFQPQATGFGPQATGFQPQQTGFQSSYTPSPLQSQATGINSFLPPALVPQATGIPASQFGNFSNPQGYNIPPVPPIPQSQTLQPLVAQKTGPPPPVRFGMGPAKRLVSQPTGRADLSKATPQNPFGFG
ncbi:hypothetical protein EG327_010739 [Venturia inaequalis]|uniref:Actin cytoskeleton-regulatory complex protein SLA1 n=1 Tax=Venturia inaequalis TaxID=5025 RepID=A0A8H3VNY7_VENIN|nr:hypothetical protein EG327_010739 [Venturia inaequalis]